jgi:hypothetical protein
MFRTPDVSKEVTIMLLCQYFNLFRPLGKAEKTIYILIFLSNNFIPSKTMKKI